jgi:hypothetical protein
VRWGAQRGEHKREAFRIELVDDIGEHEGGAHGCEKPRRGRNPWAVRGGWKTVAQAAAVVQTGTARSKTDPGLVTVALGRAQFGAQSFFQLFKNCSNL